MADAQFVTVFVRSDFLIFQVLMSKGNELGKSLKQSGRS